jgi:hypothetical protein
VNFLQNYEAKLTHIKLLTLLYNKINDLITQILLLLNGKLVIYRYITKFRKFFSKVDVYSIINFVSRKITKFLIGMQVLNENNVSFSYVICRF